MTAQEDPSLIKIQIYHELIGTHTFEFSTKTHANDIRLHIIDNSPLYLYQNFHFQYQGVRLTECTQISQIFKGDARLLVVFQPYDYFTSRYHQMRVKEILAAPAHWMIANSRDYQPKQIQESQENVPISNLNLDQLFTNPFQSPFLIEQQKKQSEFAHIVNSSGFVPPSTSRKLLGDLYYLQIRTLEDTDLHITASSEGFFVNQSTQNNFNPNPHTKFSSSISLLDLLMQVSPKFKTKFQELQKGMKITQFQKWNQGIKPISDNHVWLRQGKCWKKSNSWKNDCFYSLDKQDFAAIKDWVQIFQYQRANTNDSLYQKIGKQKLKYRVYQQFVENVREGIIKIFKGTIEPFNSSSKLEHQLFYYSNILFYFANDNFQIDDSLVSGHSANRDLLTLSCIDQIETENVYLSHSAIANYRGYKIVAKTVPSSLIKTNSQLQSVKSIFNKQNTAQTDQTTILALKKICKVLGIQSESLLVDETGTPKPIHVNSTLAACIANDNKRFILQTISFAIRDLNFNLKDGQQCYIRPEMIGIFNSRQKCQTLCNPNIGTQSNLFNIEKYKLQYKKQQSIAVFAKEIMIPSLIESFDGQMRKYLSDSRGVIYAMHKHGLSCKYLGLIYKKTMEKNVVHINIIIERTILIRSLKTLFKKAMRQTSVYMHKALIKHLFVCIFEQDTQQNNDGNKQLKTDDQFETSNNAKKSKKKKTRENETFFQISFTKPNEKYLTIKTTDVWDQIKQIAFKKYKHQLSQKQTFFKLQFSKVAILRDLSLCLGFQLEKRDYFSNNKKFSFCEDHIINIIPRLKIRISEPKDLMDFIEEGDKFIGKYQIQEAFDSYNRAFQFIFSSFGGLHQKLGLIYRKFASLHYKIGDFDTAASFAKNSLQIYQNVLGIDHIETIEALMTIGIYEFARKRFMTTEYYILKAIFLAKFAYSQCYPEIIVMHMNLSTVYQAQRKYTDAIMSLFMALSISSRVYGQSHLHTAIILSALASLHYDIPDIQQAIKFQQKSISILQDLLGVQDERVVQAKTICDGYKNIQNSKKVKEMHQKQQKNNPFGLTSKTKFNFKMPFYDFRERPAEFLWKKPRKLKYFF